MADKKRAFVTGWPVEHSRSPLIHGHWLKTFNLAGEYVKHACDPANLSDFIENMESHGFVGGNVTLPHKEQVFNLVHDLEPVAKRLGAVNTIWRENGTTKGTNTDGYGFLANLDERAPGWDSRDNRKRGALVLGAGGAARAIIDALLQREFSVVFIANRTVERAGDLANQFGPLCEALDIASLDQPARNSALIVNTTSLGMGDGRSPLDLSGFSSPMIVNDIVYTPLNTPLLLQAKALGMVAVDGLGMLLHQAVPGFEKWFGVRPTVTKELRDILLADLGENQ